MPVRIILATAGLAVGIGAALLARAHPGLSLAGDAGLATAAQLIAGWALIAAGLAHWARRRASPSGPLLVAAGLAWFAAEAANPAVGSSTIFTLGLMLSASAPAFVFHAALTHPTGRLSLPLERPLVVMAYVACVGVGGALATLVTDPVARGCLDCPRNLAYLAGSVATSEAIARAALWLVLIWSVSAVALIVWLGWRAKVELRRRAAPMLAPAAAYCGLVGATSLHGIPRGFVSNDPTDRRLWAAQAVALMAVAAGSAWDRVRSARMRSELGDLLVTLAAGPGGGVREAVARALDDPGLVIVYRRVGGDGWIDGDGREVERPAVVTELGDVAAIGHRGGTLEDAGLAREIARAALPALEHERLRAELLAQLHELRVSRARVVEAGDAERRRLERDLHDGAQQRLVALALDVRLARRRLARETEEHDAALAAVEELLQLAVADLREVAHGLHPHVLQESGLAAALLALAESDSRLALMELPDQRAAPAAEFAAYQVIAETLRRVPGNLDVRGRRDKDRLIVEIDAASAPQTLVALEDRVAALDGTITVEREADRVTLRAELPCAS